MDKLKILFDEFNDKPVVYHRIYSKITGGVTAGLLLSQLIYWAKAVKYKEFYKTDKDFCFELGMSIKELRTAKKKLKELKLVKITIKGVPAKSYYFVDIDKIMELITGQSSIAERDKLDCPKGTNWISRKGQTIYTENNTENNTDIYCGTSPQDDYSFKNQLNKMLTDKDRRMNIIAYYWAIKGYNFNNRKKYDTALKRELRPAKDLLGYTNEEIKKTCKWLKENSNFKWTIETIIKYIDEPLDEMKDGGKQKTEEDFIKMLRKQNNYKV